VTILAVFGDGIGAVELISFPNTCTRYSYTVYYSVAELIAPDWGDKVKAAAWSCRTGPQGYIGWRAGTTTLCRN
jgi:hypothetical protein